MNRKKQKQTLVESTSVALVSSVASPKGWPQLSDQALHGLAGDIVRTVGPHSEADPAAILIQLLVAVGNLIGTGLHCAVEASRHNLNFYTVLVGETSKARKGTSWGHVERLCGEVDDSWRGNRITNGLSSAEGLIAEVRDGEPALDRRLLVIEAEFASVLKVMQRDGNTLSSLLRDAWDHGNLRTMVKRDPQRATGAHISLISHVTTVELRNQLCESEQHNGFANRILWASVTRSKLLPDGGNVPKDALASLSNRLRAVQDWAMSVGDVEIKRDNAASDLWVEMYRGLSEGKPGLLGAVTARGEAQVMRLSALYAVLDRTNMVSVEHLNAAHGVWRYCLQSARYIFGDATGDPTADRIRAALAEAGAEGMTRTNIRDLFGKHWKVERLARALSMLSSLSLANCERESTGGRPVERWYATEAT